MFRLAAGACIARVSEPLALAAWQAAWKTLESIGFACMGGACSLRGGAAAGGRWQCAHWLPPYGGLPGERETRHSCTLAVTVNPKSHPIPAFMRYNGVSGGCREGSPVFPVESA